MNVNDQMDSSQTNSTGQAEDSLGPLPKDWEKEKVWIRLILNRFILFISLNMANIILNT